MTRGRRQRSPVVLAVWAATLLCGVCLGLPGAAAAALPPSPTIANFNDLPAGAEENLRVSELTAYFEAKGIGSYTQPQQQDCDNASDRSRAPIVELSPGDRALVVVRCQDSSNELYLNFAERQAYVGLSALFLFSTARPDVQLTAYDASFGDGGIVAATPVPSPAAVLGRTPLLVSDSLARIRSVRVSLPTSDRLTVDDIAFSRTLQPETEITGITTSGRSATFAFASSFGTQFRCAVDGEAPQPCTSPLIRTGLAPGRHEFRAAAVDPFGTTDPTPALQAFAIPPDPVVVEPPLVVTLQPSSRADRDGDGVLDAADNCAERANADQADRDRDGIGNACEILPPGDLPPVAGERAVVREVSGEVYVRLPRGSGANAAQAQAGFVPLKGVASVPIGSTLDARSGSARISTSVGRATRRTQAIIVAAGLARIEQARASRRAPRPFTVLALRANPGAVGACRANRTSRQVVGTLRGQGNGRYRVNARESISTVRGRALWTVQDRCDGTSVQVGRGTVRVYDRGRDRTFTARRGQRYIARGRLTGPAKGGPSARL